MEAEVCDVFGLFRVYWGKQKQQRCAMIVLENIIITHLCY